MEHRVVVITGALDGIGAATAEQMTDALIPELRAEAASTRKMPERIPPDSLAWKPHEKSRTIGEIAAHIANLPRVLSVSRRNTDPDQADQRLPSGSNGSMLSP
jgi:hypothetical protein